MPPQILSKAERQELLTRYPEDETIQRLVKSMNRGENLLRRGLYEFGVELRAEIEEFLGETPLLRPQ